MQYFNESDSKEAKIGKVIGDALAALIYIFVAALMLVPILRTFGAIQ
jgi:hypothetical protein